MDPYLARQLAHAPSLPYRIQKAVWDSEDMLARSSLVGIEDLSPEVEGLFLAERSDRLAASWARTAQRRYQAVDQVCEWVQDEGALIALSGMPKLSPQALSCLMRKATAQSSARLLQREDLEPDSRASLVERFLQGIEPMAGGAGRIAMERLGDSPEVWCEVVRHCMPAHAGLLASVPASAVRDPRLQEVALQTLEAAPTPLEDSGWNSPVTRIVKALMGARTLDSDRAHRLHKVASRLCPDLADLSAKRAQRDIPALIEQLECAPGRPCPPGNSHAQTVALLADCVSFVDLPLARLLSCGVWHLADLPKGTLDAACTQLRGDAGRDVLLSLESSCGPGSAPVVRAVELLGLWPTSSLEDPAATLRVLAACGWEPLERSIHVPAAALDTVTMSFAPVSRLLQDKDYCAAIGRAVAKLSPAEMEVALALLGEWQESLSDLLSASVSLAAREDRSLPRVPETSLP